MKKFLPFLAGLAIGLTVAAYVGCVSLKSPDIVTREPNAPGESTIQYTPPPPPEVSVEMVRKVMPTLSMLQEKTEKVADGVYVAMGYGLGSIAMIETNDGLVIVDASDNAEIAARVMAEFRKLTDQPVRYLVYTHFHPDHVQGSSAVAGESVEVIATRDFLYWLDYQYEMLGGWHRLARMNQAGVADLAYAFELPLPKNPFQGLGRQDPVIKPTIVFDDRYDFELGGKRFELFHTAGETPDHLAIWMPDQRILFAGDLYYHSFPNLSTPMLEPRPVAGWIESIDKFIALEPEYLVLGHTPPLRGAGLIRERLTNYREAIRFVHDETVKCINEVLTAEEAVARVKLPARLAELPYLRELYGRVSWSVRGIYRGYTGWYEGRGSGLNPLPASFRARELVSLAGGADKVLLRAIELQKAGEHQLAAELCDTVIHANPDDRLAHRVKAASMQYLAFGLDNLNCFGFYRSAYSLEMKAAGAE